MNQKFLILLFITIFYNGVIYAFPSNERNSEVIPPKEKPPTASPITTDHINKKVEPTPAPTTEHQTSVIQNSSSATLNHAEILGVKNATVHPDVNIKSTSETPQVIDPKNMTHASNSTNATSVIDNKNPSLVTDGKNISQPIDNKSTIPIKSATVPAEVPLGTNSSISTFTHAPQNLTNSTTGVPTNLSTTTLKINTSDITTIAPDSTSSDKVVVVHNVPTPVQEKHFDGPSFIGGIVLTIGLTAIGFIAFKYYKSGKIDMNYRTL